MKPEIIEQIKQSRSHNDARIRAIVAAALNQNTCYYRALNVLEEKLPALEQALVKMGLEITDLRYSQAGSLSDGEMMSWGEDNRLRVSISAVPVGGKFRFVKFAGYTAGGHGRNQARLVAKATQIREALQLATGIADISANPHTLEVKNEGDTKSILIVFWVS